MFEMKYHILNDFRSSTPFKQKSSDYFKDVYQVLNHNVFR